MGTMRSRIAEIIIAVNALVAAHVSLAGTPVFSEQQICKAAVGTVMGRDPKVMKIAKSETGIIYLYYVRANDGKKFSYRCKVEGSRIIWATDTGRWRDNLADEAITYTANGPLLEILQTFTDKSVSRESFKLSQLGK